MVLDLVQEAKPGSKDSFYEERGLVLFRINE